MSKRFSERARGDDAKEGKEHDWVSARQYALVDSVLDVQGADLLADGGASDGAEGVGAEEHGHGEQEM